MFKKLFLILSLFAILSCSTQSSNETSKSAFKLRPYQELKLENGLQILILENSALPRVALGLMVKTGSLYEASGQEGLASFTASLLEQGTTHRTATQIADELGQNASDISISSGIDSSFIGASSLTPQKDKLLELFSDVVLNPSFRANEIERERAQTLAAISSQQDNPSHYADILSEKENFGEHAYGRTRLGNKKIVSKFQQKDLQIFYKENYLPNNSILYVSGDINNDYVEKIKKVFSSWTKSSRLLEPQAVSANRSQSAIRLYTKPDLKQAQIRFVQRGIQRSHPDYMSLRLACLILGGDFVSRLNMRVRDQLGLTYSIHSSLDPMLVAGSIDISTFSRNEKVAEAIKETELVVRQFYEQGATATELSAAKALMAGQFPSAIETVDKLAYNLLNIRRYGVGDDYLVNFIDNLNAVTLSQVNQAIKKHIHPENFKVVVYADESQVLPQLKLLRAVEVEKVKPE